MKVFPDARALAEGLARAVVESARQAIAERGRFAIALSGGETPRAAYALLGGRFASDAEWSRVDVFFTDERFVPAEDPRNNCAMARETWLGRVPMRAEGIHAIPTTGGSVEECARRHDSELRAFFADAATPESPTFDLAIMGIGTDGHTASLFPGDTMALRERSRWALAVSAPPSAPVRERITLTLPLLNRSRRMLFAASGGRKRDVVARALADPRGRAVPEGAIPEDAIPASLARGIEATEWFVDVDAAPPSAAGARPPG